MKHRASRKFWAHYRRLPVSVQELADKNFQLLKADSRHPSLQLKKVSQMWSARVGAHYRALAVESQKDLVWFWIGTHAEYNEIIRH
jgi:hypothetical protein